MRTLILFGILILTPTVTADAKKEGKGKRSGAAASTAVSVRFGATEIQILRDYYSANPVQLPPGLRKKYARTGTLPPGWQKKMQAFPTVVESRLPPACGYCGRGVIDGYAVVYDKRTRIILDVIQLVADIVR